MASKNHCQKSSTPNTTTAEILRNSLSSSAFGEELRKGLPTDNTIDYQSINITSQITYAGNKQSFDLNFLFVDVSSEDYRGSLP